MVGYSDEPQGRDSWIVNEQLERQLGRIIRNKDCVSSITHKEYKRNFVDNPNHQESRSVIYHFAGVDDPKPEVPPSRTYAMFNVDEKEEDGIWQFMFRIGVPDVDKVIEKGDEMMDAESHHIGPPHIETEYETKVVHYIFSGDVTREDIISKAKSSMEFFCYVVDFAIENEGML